jgi:hypothetical protein
MCASLTKQEGLAAHTQPACTTPHTTVTTSTQKPPIMASSPSASNWECGACASFTMRGKYCPLCAIPCPKHQALLAALAADVAVHAAVVAVSTAVALAIPSASMPRAVVGAPTAVAALPTVVMKMAGTVIGLLTPVAKKSKGPVAREAKVSKECAPATADVAATPKVIAAPMPVAKAPGPFYPTGFVVDVIGAKTGDQGCICEEHTSNCGELMAKNVVVCLRKVQIQVEGRDETAIAAYWVTDGVDCCRIGFLPCHMVRHPTRYHGALSQVTRVFNMDPTCCNTAKHCAFHKN